MRASPHRRPDLILAADAFGDHLLLDPDRLLGELGAW